MSRNPHKRRAYLRRVAALIDGAVWRVENGGDLGAAVKLLRRYAQWLRREAGRYERAESNHD